MTAPSAVLRPHAELQHASELRALDAVDDRPRPPGWRLSPWAVVTYVLGGALPDGTVVTPKYVGQRRLVEIAVATLATDRALLLLGVPGTAKTMVSEHLAAAISGDSTLLVQGTAGTTEETLRYGWNYARLLAEGPSEEALVPGPVYRAMGGGSIVRVEEITRMPPEVQDALVTILTQPKNALVKQYQRLFELEDTKLTFTEDALTAIAKRAIARKTGARGLRSIMEEILLNTMFDLPGMDNVEEVVVNEEAATSAAQPLMIYADQQKEGASAG